MKKYKISYFTGMILSMLVGLWHFFVPWLYGWHSYIPSQYENLIVAIDWVNLCFSFFLFGLSLLLLMWSKKIFAGCREAVVLYGFMLLLWVFRVVIALVEPLPLEPIAWPAYTQLAGTISITLLLLFPFIKLARKNSGRA